MDPTLLIGIIMGSMGIVGMFLMQFLFLVDTPLSFMLFGKIDLVKGMHIPHWHPLLRTVPKDSIGWTIQQDKDRPTFARIIRESTGKPGMWFDGERHVEIIPHWAIPN